MRTIRPCVLMFAAGLAACSSGGTDNTPGGGGNANFTATIDGAPWAALTSSTAAQVSGVGTFSIVGSQADGTGISLTLYNIGKPGTYALGVGANVFGGAATVSSSAGSWITPLSGAAGSVTITAVSSTHITGTFSFTAAPLAGGSNRAVSNGAFDLGVTGSGTATVPDKNGSTFGGTLGGVAWNAATVVMIGAPASGTLTIGLSNTSHNINIVVSAFNGAGTYVMGTGSGAVQRSVSVLELATTKTWGYTNANTSGSLTVTSYTATRMAGTYNFTLQAVSGGGAANVMTGSFDLGYPQLLGN